jgi:hypothetical protein
MLFKVCDYTLAICRTYHLVILNHKTQMLRQFFATLMNDWIVYQAIYGLDDIVFSASI